MNLRLDHVVFDITGATGIKVARAIDAGGRDVLADDRDVRCKSVPETLSPRLQITSGLQTEGCLTSGPDRNETGAGPITDFGSLTALGRSQRKSSANNLTTPTVWPPPRNTKSCDRSVLRDHQSHDCRSPTLHSSGSPSRISGSLTVSYPADCIAIRPRRVRSLMNRNWSRMSKG